MFIMKTTTTAVRTAAALALTCGIAVAGASAASAESVPYPPALSGPGVVSTVQVEGTVVTRSTSGIAVGSVVGKPAAAPVTAPSVPEASAPSSSGLAYTGADVLPLAAGGGVLLLVGAGLVLGARRRRA
jgi:LPXTG-motif cell wall-anchored protein